MGNILKTWFFYIFSPSLHVLSKTYIFHICHKWCASQSSLFLMVEISQGHHLGALSITKKKRRNTLWDRWYIVWDRYMHSHHISYSHNIAILGLQIGNATSKWYKRLSLGEGIKMTHCYFQVSLSYLLLYAVVTEKQRK